METVTVSPKFQVVIPRAARKSMDLRPGPKLAVFCVDGVLELVPVSSPSELRGFLKGMDTWFEREEPEVRPHGAGRAYTRGPVLADRSRR